MRGVEGKKEYSGGSARRGDRQRSHCERRHLRYYSYELLIPLCVNVISFRQETLFWCWIMLILTLCVITNLFSWDYLLSFLSFFHELLAIMT